VVSLSPAEIEFAADRGVVFINIFLHQDQRASHARLLEQPANLAFCPSQVSRAVVVAFTLPQGVGIG